MKVLVIGAGVLGSNLAKNLHRAGRDVTLLARGDRYRQVKNGLVIRSIPGFRERTYYLKVIEELKKEDRYDVVFVCVQYTQLDDVITMLSSNASSNIVFIGNNLKAEYYSELLKDKNVLFGFALTAGRREFGKVVSIDLKSITLGSLKGQPDRKAFVRKLFYRTGYRLHYEDNIGDYLRCHAAYVVPAAIGVYYVNGEIKRIATNERLLQTVIRANLELFRGLENRGIELLPKFFSEYRSRKYHIFNNLFYRLMAFTFLGKLCAVDHAMFAREELGRMATDLEEIVYPSGLRFKGYQRLKNGQSYI